VGCFPIGHRLRHTFIQKPSERTPARRLRLAPELLHRKPGLPDGVFNVVNGDKKRSNVLHTHRMFAGAVASSAPPR